MYQSTNYTYCIISTKFLFLYSSQALWWHSSQEDVKKLWSLNQTASVASAGAKILSKQEEWFHSYQAQANIIGLEWKGKQVLHYFQPGLWAYLHAKHNEWY